MADKKRYQVQSACVIVPIVTSEGDYLHTIYAGGVFEADPDNPRIVHNVESGYILELGAKANPGVDTAGVPVIDDKRPDESEIGAPVELNDPGVVNEEQQGRASAAAKLPPDGSAPDGRASDAVRIEWLAKNGYDYNELKKQDSNELKKLVAAVK